MYFFEKTLEKSKNIKCVFAGHSHKGSFVELVTKLELKIEIATKPEGSKGFIPVKIRWVVERTFFADFPKIMNEQYNLLNL